MILNDKQIKALIDSEQLKIDPFTPRKVVEDSEHHHVVSYGLQSFGYDIRLSNEYMVYKSDVLLDPLCMSEENVIRSTSDETGWDIRPHEYCMAQCKEYIKMPSDILGLVLGKSTWARLGLVVNCTPLEPGWYGRITLELSNTTGNTVHMLPDQGIAQILFFQGENPDAVYSGKYNGQTEPTLPR